MAFPFLFHSNFEANYGATTSAEWTSTSDTGSLLDYPHYSVIASDPNSEMPYHGAFLCRNLLGDTNDHTLTSTSITCADGSTVYIRWYMALSKDFRFTADDTFNVFEYQQAGGTVEASIGFRVTNSSQLIEIGIGDGTAPTTFAQWPGRGKWVCVEALFTCSTVGAGVVTLFLDGTQVLTLTSQTHAAAIGKGVLGSQDTLATTLGAIYYDDFICDDGRIYPDRERFPSTVTVMKSGHAFVGPGSINGAALLVLGSNNETMNLYDTDTTSILDAQPVVELKYNVQTSVTGPIHFKRGCYVELGGTNTRGEVFLTRNTDKFGDRGPLYYSEWGMRWYGNNRKQRPLNV